MRNALLAMSVAIALTTRELRGQEHTSRPPDVGAGRVAWFDLTTSNLAQSREFYGKLFDWRFLAVKGGDGAVEIVAQGMGIGTLRTGEGKPSGFNGVIYIQVNDIEATCRRVKELGGTIVPGFPFNLPDGAGAVAIALDPSGHPVGLYSRARLGPAVPPAR